MSLSLTDSLSQYLEEDKAAFASNTDFTISAWVKVASSGEQGIVTIPDKDDAGVGAILAISTAGKVRLHYVGVTSYILDSTSTATVGQWLCVIGSYNSTSGTLKLDVTGQAQLNFSAPSITGAFDRTSIGRYGDLTPGSYFNGLMAHVAFWSDELADVDKATLLAGAAPNGVSSGTLISYLPLANDPSDTEGFLSLTAFNSPTYSADNPFGSTGITRALTRSLTRPLTR